MTDIRPPGRGLRAYRLLLRLLPLDLREDFEADMEELFLRRLGAARGLAGRSWVWTRAVADVGFHAVLARFDRRTITKRGGDGTMGRFIDDLRLGARSLARMPAVTAVVAGTLALGIGAATATFSAVNGVLLKPLPYPEPDRLVAIWPEMNFNTALVRDALEAVPALESASGFSGWSFTLTGEGEPLEVEGARVSVDHFRVMGVRPVLGRGFTPDEGLPGGDGVAVLSHGLWMRAFGGDPSVVGRTVGLATNDMDRRTVIGVLPPDYRPLRGDPDVWVPLPLTPGLAAGEDNSWYVNHRVARLAPGATLAQADEQVREFARDVGERLPSLVDEDDVRAADVRLLSEVTVGSVGPILWVALGAVGLVLLMACANVANLLLARGEARRHDLAVRVALGAGRRRVVRLLLAESGLLALLGGVLGVALSFALVRLMIALAPADFPRVSDIAVEGPVLLFALAATAVSALVAGLAPAVRTSRVEATASLGRAARTAGGRRGSRLTTALVGAEAALAVVVVVGSGLMLRSLQRMTAEDPGLRTEGVVVLRPNPPSGSYPDGTAFQTYYAQVLERVEAMPGVAEAAAIHLLPGTLDNWSFPTRPEGIDVGEGPVPSVNVRLVTPGYFSTVGIPLLRGRALTPADDGGAERVVVVNRAFVDRFWPGEEGLGRTLTMGGSRDPHRIVGVVDDVRQHGLGLEPRPEMYFAHAQLSWDATFWIVARMEEGPPALSRADALRDAVWSVDPDVPVSGLDELSRVYDASAATTRFLAVVLGAFGGLALLLGAVGVFGVTSFAMSRRTSEFGVRIALGARSGEVLVSALGRSLAPVGIGLAAGVALAVFAGRALSSALYQVAPSDPVTLAGVAGLLAGVATLASLLPALRASRVDPVTVLKGD